MCHARRVHRLRREEAVPRTREAAHRGGASIRLRTRFALGVLLTPFGRMRNPLRLGKIPRART